MNLLLCTNQHYLPLTMVAINSIMKNWIFDDTKIFIFCEKLTDNEIDVLNNIDNVYPIKIDLSEFDKHKDINNSFPNIVFARLLCGEFLPKDISKILYLDADTIIIKPLDYLYNLKLDDNTMFYGCPDISNNQESITKFDVYPSHDYINSGVLLINVDLCRKKISKKDIIDFSVRYKNKICYKDQDLINALYHDYIKIIPRGKYNYMGFAKKNKQQFLKETKNTSILHFANIQILKPWSKNYVGKRYYKKLYKKFTKKTLYENLILKNMRINTIFYPYYFIKEKLSL